nr:cytochrome P450 [Tanacetum cinerariifolium]
MDYILITITLSIASYLFANHIYRKYSNLPPTIFPCIPIIGHLHLIKNPLCRTLAKISAKHGPILLLRFGSRKVLLVSTPSLSEECFTKNDVIFANRPRLLYGKILGSNYTNLCTASYGDHWRKLRRIANAEIFSSFRLNELHEVRADEGRLLIRKLATECSSPANMKKTFHEMTLNVMMRMIFGKRYYCSDMKEEGKKFQEISKETFLVGDASNLGDHLPFLNWFGVRGVEKRMVALQKKRNAFFQGVIEEYRKGKLDEVENKKHKTMMEVLLQLQENEPKYYTDDLIKTFLLVRSCTDTSSGTMEWAFALLLNHPHVLKKAQNEIDSHVGKERFVDESDMANLPYLRCIVNETLRLYPAGPVLVPHESSEECTVGGYHIPQGTMLLVNQWAMHHDPDLWSDPESFQPERFEGIEGARDGFRFMPFGFGRRCCPGEGLATRIMGLTVGLLIQCFDWERPDEEMVDMTEGRGITLPKAQPLIAKYKPRQMMSNLISQA